MDEDDFFGDGSSADEAPPDNRSGARQVALQALYWEASHSGRADDAVDELCSRFGLSSGVRAFAGTLVGCVHAHGDGPLWLWLSPPPLAASSTRPMAIFF